MAADTLFETPFGHFRLRRYPARRDEPLRAWNSADALILEEIYRSGTASQQTLVVNDEHGALCVALQAQQLWTDSALSAIALQRNLAANQRPGTAISWSTSAPAVSPGIVVLRVPKQLTYLEYQLAKLAPVMATGTQLHAGGMDKHLSPQVPELLERYIGPTRRHRGQRKARLFTAIRDGRVNATALPRTAYYCDELGAELQTLPNVFSQQNLDGGSRLLLAQLGQLEPAAVVLDLACGNGVLGLAAYQCGIAARVIFADESALAVAATRLNTGQLFGAESGVFAFHHNDGLEGYTGPAADLIVCNPPFHLHHTVDDYAGRRLLVQCAHHLQPGGRLCMVANRHLDYLPTLKRHFSTVEKLSADRRFNVWLARRG